VGCSHSATVTTITAGLAREVCETCAHVSLRFVESAVQLFPDLGRRIIQVAGARPDEDDVAAGIDPAERYRRCHLCSQPAVFEIPDGMMCDEHAWQAAARLNWEVTDPWVPIRIDTSSA